MTESLDAPFYLLPKGAHTLAERAYYPQCLLACWTWSFTAFDVGLGLLLNPGVRI